MNLIFETATPQDLPEVMALYRSLVGTPGCTWDAEYPGEEMVAADIDAQELYLLRQPGGAIVAAAFAGTNDELAALPWRAAHPCDLARVGVLQSWQNRGLAAALLRQLLPAMQQKGFDGARLLVSRHNPAAIALYEKTGFHLCGEVTMYGIDFLCYELLF